MARQAGPTAPRLGHLEGDAMDEAQQALYSSITTGARSSGPRLFSLVDDDGGLQGPFEAMLRSPKIGAALARLGAAVRFGTALSDRTREMAILAVAAHWDSAFERYAHEAVARHAGVTDGEIEALRLGAAPDLADPDERTALRAVVALLERGDLDDGEYGDLVARLGERGAFELTTLVGYYATLALQLRVFRVGAPDTPGPTSAEGPAPSTQ